MRIIMKKIVLLLAVFSFAFQTTSCKSKKTQDDTQIVENADVEKIEAEDAALLATADTATTNVGPVDDSLQAALGEVSTEVATDPALTTTDAAVTENAVEPTLDVAAAPVLDESNLGSVPTPETEIASSNSLVATDAGLTNSAITEMPVSEPAAQVAADTTITETPVVESTPTVTASETTAVSTASTKSFTTSGVSKKTPERKIAEVMPYEFGDGWVNTVYISRPKEKLKDISQKIYGQDKTKELKKINSFLTARSPNGGDKIYYVSPNRPSDSMKTLSFYEDTGMIAETYIAKKGDNLKKVSKNLLGYENAYKEIWSTNTVASKGALEDGETLRYWKSGSAFIPTNVATNTQTMGQAQVIESTSQSPGQTVAQNSPPAEMQNATAPQAELPPPPTMPEGSQMPLGPPPTDQSLAQNSAPPQPASELPPPPPAPDMTAETNAIDAAALTPPPPTDEIAAAPVPAKTVTPNMEEEQMTEGMSSDTTAMLGGSVVLCGLLAFALFRRNKKKKEVEMASMSETNVGT